MKTCRKCEIEKELTEFYKDKTRSDGLQYNCKNCVKIYRDNNKEERNKKQRIYDRGRSSQRKEYYEANKETIIKKSVEYSRRKREEDPLFKLSHNIRRLVKKSLSYKGWEKKTKTQEILGCDFKTFEAHLNDNLYGFTIDDKGLDVDHIIPVSTATTEEELLKLNHYTNLQLLPSEYNRHIKSDKPFDEKHFEQWLINQ